MGFLAKYVDPIEAWVRGVIASLPDDLGKPGSEFSTASMLEEGLGIYLSLEQDPYWGAVAMAKYLSDEGVPVPRRIIDEMRRVSKASPACCNQIEKLLCSTGTDTSMNEFIKGLSPVPR